MRLFDSSNNFIKDNFVLYCSDHLDGKTFMNRVTNSKTDFFQEFINILNKRKFDYCIIGGLAVNAYAEPTVTLDLDVVVVTNQLDNLTEILKKKYKVEEYEHSMNVSSTTSDLRIQIQTDSRYQKFIKRAKAGNILGYDVKVALIEDLLQGKIWAYLDSTRRMSKRQKDLVDIIRLIEVKPELESQLPDKIKRRLKEI